mgnify:CR=1 FL=1
MDFDRNGKCNFVARMFLMVVRFGVLCFMYGYLLGYGGFFQVIPQTWNLTDLKYINEAVFWVLWLVWMLFTWTCIFALPTFCVMYVLRYTCRIGKDNYNKVC